MSWSDDDEDQFENGKPKKIHRKSRKDVDRLVESRTDNGADDSYYRRKRAGKRSHRKKTHKDEFWEGGDH